MSSSTVHNIIKGSRDKSELCVLYERGMILSWKLLHGSGTLLENIVCEHNLTCHGWIQFKALSCKIKSIETPLPLLGHKKHFIRQILRQMFDL